MEYGLSQFQMRASLRNRVRLAVFVGNWLKPVAFGNDLEFVTTISIWFERVLTLGGFWLAGSTTAKKKN